MNNLVNVYLMLQVVKSPSPNDSYYLGYLMIDTENIYNSNEELKTRLEFYEDEENLKQISSELDIVSNCDLIWNGADGNIPDNIESHIAVAVFKHEKNLFTNKSYSYIFFHACKPSSFIDTSKFFIKKEMKLGDFIGFRILDRDPIAQSELYCSLIKTSYLFNNPSSSKNIKYEYGNFLKNIVGKKSRKYVGMAKKFTKTYFVSSQDKILKINNNEIDSAWFWSMVNRNVKKIDMEFLEKMEFELSKKISVENTLDHYWSDSD